MTASPERRGFLVAAPNSGAGKTTVTNVVLRALCGMGLKVQPFKVGPDFIDAAHHSEICGRPSINLDLWMMGRDGVRLSYERWSREAGAAVIEAMGGLYDGADGTERGSPADVAKLLDVPVVLVLDAWGMTRTTTAVLQGLVAFDPELRIAGCVLNRVGSPRHAQMIERSMPPRLRRLLLGFIPRRSELAIPERHLGLTTVQELKHSRTAREEAQALASENLDVERLVRMAETREAVSPQSRKRSAGQVRAGTNVRLAVAEDDAFHFYYEENLRLLREVGFQLVGFRPTADARLPPDVDAVYVGGGYPESFAAQLQANASLAAEMRERATAGMPIYGECGGYIYLGRSLTGFDGTRFEMSGVLPIDFAMDRGHLAIAYVSVSTRAASPLGPRGASVRGQEFHQSRIVAADRSPDLYDITTSDGRTYREGHRQGNVIGSYAHLHLASNPRVATSLLLAARAHRAKRSKA